MLLGNDLSDFGRELDFCDGLSEEGFYFDQHKIGYFVVSSHFLFEQRDFLTHLSHRLLKGCLALSFKFTELFNLSELDVFNSL